MRKRQDSAGFLFFNVLFSGFLVVFAVSAIGFGRCFGAAEALPDVEKYQVMRIMIYGSSPSPEGGTVSASVSILDTDGNECAVIERSWNGEFLSADFVSAEFSGRKIFFPQKIYGGSAVYSVSGASVRRKGSFLAPYYVEHDQNLLLGAGFSAQDRRNLAVLSRFALSPSFFFAAGFSHKYRVDFSRCETGKVYCVWTDFRGGLALEEL